MAGGLAAGRVLQLFQPPYEFLRGDAPQFFFADSDRPDDLDLDAGLRIDRRHPDSIADLAEFIKDFARVSHLQIV